MRMTPEEYKSYLARRATKQSGPAPADAATKESVLHAVILSECKRRGWLVFRSSMAHATFRTPGEPDLEIWADGGRTFHIECKTGKGKLSIDQRAIAAAAERIGHKVYVVRSYREFLEVVK